jgi:predicted TIM-barrel fold metal-dependent hydrolase
MAHPPRVDVHVHIYPSRAAGEYHKQSYEIWEYGEKPASVRFSRHAGEIADVERAMTAAGFDYAVSVNLFAVDLERGEALAMLPADLPAAERKRALAEVDATMPERLRRFNRWACDAARTSGRILPFIAVDPWAMSPEENAAHLAELADHYGARGIKLHPAVQRFAPDDPRMTPVYRTCLERGLVVLSHSGTTRGAQQYAEPRAFAALARAYPDLPLVLAHLGGGSWRQTRELARAFPRVWFDCCEIIEWTGAPNAPTTEELARLIRDIGPDRVLLGTDFPWYDLDRTAERVMDLPLLAREEKEKILGANAMRLLRLDAPRPAR